MPRYLTAVDLASCGLRAARIHSLERSLYIVELDTPAGSAWLGSDAETRAVFRNISAAREALASAGALSITLVHASAFDEMVGLGPRGFLMSGLVLGATTPAPDAALLSDAEMDVVAVRARASYEFGSEDWYVRPTLELDAARTDAPDFEETATVAGHPFLLRARGDARVHYMATPHLELGMQRAIGKTMQLRAYLDGGVRLAPEADRDIALQVVGADAADGYFRNRIDTPLATGLLKVGAQLYRADALDLRLEYGLERNGDFRTQNATARVAWHF